MPEFPDPLVPELPSSAPPPRPAIHTIFFGSDGLRAGWGLLLYLAILALLVRGTSAIFHMAHSHAAPAKAPAAVQTAAKLIKLSNMLPNEGILAFFVVLATWIMAKIEGRPVSAYGLAPARAGRNFFAGFLWGLFFLSLLVFCLRAAGLLVFDGRLLYGAAGWHYGLLWLIGFLLTGLFEENLFRGYLQFTLARGLTALYQRMDTRGADALGFWTAAFLLSFGFGLVHTSNPGESPIGILSAGLIGVVFCLSLWRTGSLWWAIGMHAAWDWAESFLYGVSDSGAMVQGHLFATHPAGRPLLSGGLTGPEGSILIVPIVALIALAVVFTLPPRPQSEGTRGHLDLP